MLLRHSRNSVTSVTNAEPLTSVGTSQRSFRSSCCSRLPVARSSDSFPRPDASNPDDCVGAVNDASPTDDRHEALRGSSLPLERSWYRLSIQRENLAGVSYDVASQVRPLALSNSQIGVSGCSLSVGAEPQLNTSSE